MSAYKKIETKFKNLKSLTQALEEVVGKNGFTVAENPKVNSLGMYGYHDDLRPERVAINIPRKTVNKFSGGLSNDLGFAWDDSTKSYSMIISDYDSGNLGTTRLANNVKQLYAYHELSRQAKMKGYSVSKQTDQSGVIRLTLKKY